MTDEEQPAPAARPAQPAQPEQPPTTEADAVAPAPDSPAPPKSDSPDADPAPQPSATDPSSNPSAPPEHAMRHPHVDRDPHAASVRDAAIDVDGLDVDADYGEEAPSPAAADDEDDDDHDEEEEIEQDPAERDSPDDEEKDVDGNDDDADDADADADADNDDDQPEPDSQHVRVHHDSHTIDLTHSAENSPIAPRRTGPPPARDPDLAEPAAFEPGASALAEPQEQLVVVDEGVVVDVDAEPDHEREEEVDDHLEEEEEEEEDAEEERDHDDQSYDPENDGDRMHDVDVGDDIEDANRDATEGTGDEMIDIQTSVDEKATDDIAEDAGEQDSGDDAGDDAGDEPDSAKEGGHTMKVAEEDEVQEMGTSEAEDIDTPADETAADKDDVDISDDPARGESLNGGLGASGTEQGDDENGMEDSTKAEANSFTGADHGQPIPQKPPSIEEAIPGPAQLEKVPDVSVEEEKKAEATADVATDIQEARDDDGEDSDTKEGHAKDGEGDLVMTVDDAPQPSTDEPNEALTKKVDDGDKVEGAGDIEGGSKLETPNADAKDTTFIPSVDEDLLDRSEAQDEAKPTESQKPSEVSGPSQEKPDVMDIPKPVGESLDGDKEQEDTMAVDGESGKGDAAVDNESRKRDAAIDNGSGQGDVKMEGFQGANRMPVVATEEQPVIESSADTRQTEDKQESTAVNSINQPVVQVQPQGGLEEPISLSEHPHVQEKNTAEQGRPATTTMDNEPPKQLGAAEKDAISPGTTSFKPISTTLTAPTFGINQPSRTGPVSFSSPPSFLQPRLNPMARPFLPPFGGVKKGEKEGKEGAVSSASISIPTSTVTSKENEGPSSVLSKLVKEKSEALLATGIATAKELAANKEGEKPAMPSTKIDQDKPTGVSTTEPMAAEQNPAKKPAGVFSESKIEKMIVDSSAQDDTVVPPKSSADLPSKVPGEENKQKDSSRALSQPKLSTPAASIVTARPPTKSVTVAPAQPAREQQTLKRKPVDGGMMYSVNNVVVIERAGGAKPRRAGLLTIELKDLSTGESLLEISRPKGPGKTLLGSVSSQKDVVRIKKIVKKPYVISLTVLGPSGTEKDGIKYFLHFQQQTFQVIYDVCIKCFVENPPNEMSRPKVVSFQTPAKDQKVAKTRTPIPRQISAQGAREGPSKPATGDHMKLLHEKMAALRKKKAERHPEAVKDVGIEANAQQAAGNAATKGKSDPNQNQKPSARSMDPTQVKVGPAATARLAAPPSVPGLTLKPTSRPIPSSPKKRPAFRIEEKAENVLKKARLTAPKKRQIPVVTERGRAAPSAMAVERPSSMKTAQKAVAWGRAVKTEAQTPQQQKRSSIKQPQVQKSNAVPKVAVPKALPVVTPIVATVPVPRAAKPAGEIISKEEKARLEKDGRRLSDILFALEKTGELSSVTDLEDEDEQPASFSRCDPTNVSDFFDRVHTFRPSKWAGFAEGHSLNPVECARHGWYNSGVNKLKSSEGAEIVLDVSQCVGAKAIQAEEDRVRRLILGKGHKLLSGWIGKSCVDAFATLAGSGKALGEAQMKQRAEEMRVLGLPQSVKQAVAGDVGDGGAEATLAKHNWALRVVEEDVVDLCCDWCNRSIPVKPFCLIGDGVGDVEFDVRNAHYSFCPFRKAGYDGQPQDVDMMDVGS